VNYGEAVFGIREIKLTDADGTNVVVLPSGIVMHFTEQIQTEEFKAEDIRIAARSFTVGVNWELEAGGISLAAYAKLTGRTATPSGSTPNRLTTFNAVAGGEFPYLRVYGRALDDATRDIHCKIYRCKLTSIEGTFRQGQFWVTSCAGISVKDSSLGFYQFVQHETGVTLT